LEDVTHSSDHEAFREAALSSLVELQRFLAEELEDFEKGGGDQNFNRAFRPLTDGLGLESPRKKEAPLIPSAKVTASNFDGLEPDGPSAFSVRGQLEDAEFGELDESELTVPKARATVSESVSNRVPEASAPSAEPTRLSAGAATAAATATYPETTPTMPPPMPKASWIRRVQGGLIDEIFVLTLWALALVITSNLLSGFSTGFSLSVFRDFSKPLFTRFVALEFATLWLCYFAIFFGVLDMTFGMWVWGLRLSYGDTSQDSVFAKKVSRILFSFFFFAPILPTLFLALRFNGKNLLDSLSGTHLYRTGF